MSDKGRRFIGIRHRTKRTADGEARPTEVTVLVGEESTGYSLSDETAELDWVLGRYPLSWRRAKEGEDLSQLPKHHIRTRKKKDSDEETIQVPRVITGFQPGDTVGMILGGSGDNLAYALSRRGEEIGARVLRLPPHALKELRGERDKDEDAATLAQLVRDEPGFFYQVLVRDRNLIWLRECLQVRTDAMKARMACAQRIRSRLIGHIFCSPEGLYPEGTVEELFDEAKANDTILAVLIKEENVRTRKLARALEILPVWQELLVDVDGVGPAIAARIVAAIGDIRRFETPAKLKAFCGVHVTPDGRFARRRHGEVANWHPNARQALFLLGDQFNRRSDSVWGKKLRRYKVNIRVKHPHPVVAGEKLITLYRRIERFLLSAGATINTEGLKVDSTDVLIEILKAGVSELVDIDVADDHTETIDELESAINELSVPGKGRTMYTAGHIHRMATWRAISRFVEWLHREWWALERRTEEAMDEVA